jgi:hypothetical protein
VTRAMDRGLFACAQRSSALVFAARSRRETVACLRGDGMRIEVPCRQNLGDNLVRLREECAGKESSASGSHLSATTVTIQLASARAEIGLNHGDLSICNRLIEAAVPAGCDARNVQQPHRILLPHPSSKRLPGRRDRMSVSTLEEIEEAAASLDRSKLILPHCTGVYPACLFTSQGSPIHP